MTDTTAGQAEPLPDGWYQVTNKKGMSVVYRVVGNAIPTNIGTIGIEVYQDAGCTIEAVEVCDIDALAKMRQALAAAQARIAELIEANTACTLHIASQNERINRFVELVDQLERQLAERDTSFDLRWNADMQAIQRWQEATGEELKWPNHVDLCVWLMQALAAAQERIAELEAQLADPPAMTDEVRNVILAALTEYEDARNKFWDGHPDAMRDRDEARAAIAYLAIINGETDVEQMATKQKGSQHDTQSS